MKPDFDAVVAKWSADEVRRIARETMVGQPVELYLLQEGIRW